jgi:hypothetical protein
MVQEQYEAPAVKGFYEGQYQGGEISHGRHCHSTLSLTYRGHF